MVVIGYASRLGLVGDIVAATYGTIWVDTGSTASMGIGGGVALKFHPPGGA